MSEERTITWQLKELQKLVDPAFVKTAKEVKGSFTTGDYVTYLLNRIFSPAKWSFTILKGPDMTTLSDQKGYAQVIGRLEVTFADGSKVHQDDVGIWPLVATGARRGGTLDETAPERFETVCKAARTDCLKNASYNLGTCFAPLSDGALVGFLQREEARQGLPELNESAAKSEADLFGIAKEREGEVIRREVAINAEKSGAKSHPARHNGKPSRWQNFLADNEIPEEDALKALGQPSVDAWMRANHGKTERDAYAEILANINKR